ncbi:hypothetical protein LCGC14_1539980 [marine sediment metagenome]|uniref:Uncharacterized protein n=1 Tax=marine sediment metagenome TaxID=412755 RepID=A0A0F9L9D9_9ZZZZ
MTIQNLIKLNSIVAEGFLMNNIISLFKEEGHIINDREIEILKNAKSYIKLIRNGQEFIKKNKVGLNFEKSLNAYSISLKALRYNDNKINLEKYNNTINNCQTQVEKTLKIKMFLNEKMNDVFLLFNSIRTILLHKANNISNQDEFTLI